VTATFWTVAALFCGVAILVLFVPIWRHRRRGGRWSVPGLVASLLIAPFAFGLYFYVTNWDAELAARVNSESALLEQLARHLDGNPTDVEGWRLLAASYMQLGRYGEGRAAYERVWALTPQPNDELKLNYAEAQILSDRSSITGEAGGLVEEVLAANPDNNPKALWYGGLVALELGRDDAVRTRWLKLLALNPPPDVAQVVTTQLATLGAVASEGAPAAVEPVGPEIKLSVTLGSALSLSDLGPAAQLFIIARAAEGGPPIAVIRQPPNALPGEFSLSDANSMIQGRSLSAYPQITVVARLSHSGQPTAQPGDWQAEAVVRPGDPATVALVIDQVVQ
jgi:cytochrome c-type biogenesis protein CcmH